MILNTECTTAPSNGSIVSNNILAMIPMVLVTSSTRLFHLLSGVFFRPITSLGFDGSKSIQELTHDSVSGFFTLNELEDLDLSSNSRKSLFKQDSICAPR